MTMHPRYDFAKAAPDAYKAVLALETYVKGCGLPARLVHLIKIRASIVNGCAFCLDMHLRDARKDGMAGQELDLIAAWHEALVYTPAERAVLAWTDALTLLAQTRAPDAEYADLRAHFSEADITRIGVAIGTINVWNRLVMGARVPHPVEAKQAA